MEIRKIRENDDLDAIGNIYADSWKYAYKGIVPQEYLDTLSGSRWKEFLTNSNGDSIVVIDNGKYIGTAAISESRDEDMPGWGEINTIYLLPEYFGKGYSKPLFEYAINELLKKGFKDIYLWVFDKNARARGFYEKNGFQKTCDMTSSVIIDEKLLVVKYIKHF
ncbi:MAG: GNAT family N-acetyltransferase [Clostridioides sp.]|jgi:L-amino acid N-acyltransferase YncA|nr:GNAT family N-acetyltransferase [Clostridioides sp.]